MAFDAKQFLTDHHIPWDNQGKHARPGWIQIKCPYCSGHAGWHGKIRLDFRK